LKESDQLKSIIQSNQDERKNIKEICKLYQRLRSLDYEFIHHLQKSLKSSSTPKKSKINSHEFAKQDQRKFFEDKIKTLSELLGLEIMDATPLATQSSSSEFIDKRTTHETNTRSTIEKLNIQTDTKSFPDDLKMSNILSPSRFSNVQPSADSKDHSEKSASLVRNKESKDYTNFLSNYIRRESQPNSGSKPKQKALIKFSSQLSTPKSFGLHEPFYHFNKGQEGGNLSSQNIKKPSGLSNQYNLDKKKNSEASVVNDHFSLENEMKNVRKNIENFISKQKSTHEAKKTSHKAKRHSYSMSFQPNNANVRLDSGRKKGAELSPRLDRDNYLKQVNGRHLEAHHLYNKLLGLLNSNEQQIAKINNSSLKVKEESTERSSITADHDYKKNDNHFFV